MKKSKPEITARPMEFSGNAFFSKRFVFGVFTLPDGTGGTPEAMDDFWAFDTWAEHRAARCQIDFDSSFSGTFEWEKDEGTVSKQVRSNNKRTIKAGSNGHLTDAEWSAMIELYEEKCAYCLKKMRKIYLDHVFPVVRGGETSIDNVAPACMSCNSRKHAKNIDEWLSPRRRKRFSARHEEIVFKVYQKIGVYA